MTEAMPKTKSLQLPVDGHWDITGLGLEKASLGLVIAKKIEEGEHKDLGYSKELCQT